jgi:hypothetical protein
MNDKGKELAAKKIVLAIKVMLQENTRTNLYDQERRQGRKI